MNWTQLKIYTSKVGLDVITGVLIDNGINGFVVEDPDDFAIIIDEMKDTWDIMDEELLKLKDKEHSITVYLSDNEQGREMYNCIKKNINELKEKDNEKVLGRLEFELDNVKEEDWANNWKEFFKPFTVGEKFAVKPTWEDFNNEEDRIVLEIDPGASFGTGMHETTQLCLMALEEYVEKGDSVLDVGCGSGILSVAAAKVGADKITAIDIDENAVEITKSTAKVNSCEEKINAFKGDLACDVDGEFDIIVANIFAHILVRLTPDASRLLKNGGIYLTSGIIKDTLEDVLKAYKDNGFEVLKVENKGEWCLVAGKKK